MPRSIVGLLAAVGATMFALVGLTHGDLVPVVIASAGVATWIAASSALSDPKKSLPTSDIKEYRNSESEFAALTCGNGPAC
jgi:hypothetical protein